MFATGVCKPRLPATGLLRAMLALLCGAASLAAAAQSGAATFQDPLGSVSGRAAEGVRVDVTALSLPRLDGNESASRVQRLDVSLLPQQPSALGISLGLVGLSPSMPAGPGTGADSAPGVTLGMHWRYSPDNSNRLDILAWRRVSSQPDTLSLIQSRQAEYGARVEMNLSSGRHSGLVASRAFVGLQLDGGARVGVKRSAGKPLLYYRNAF